MTKYRVTMIRDLYAKGPAEAVLETLSLEAAGRDGFVSRTYMVSGDGQEWLVDLNAPKGSPLAQPQVMKVEELESH